MSDISDICYMSDISDSPESPNNSREIKNGLVFHKK